MKLTSGGNGFSKRSLRSQHAPWWFAVRTPTGATTQHIRMQRFALLINHRFALRFFVRSSLSSFARRNITTNNNNRPDLQNRNSLGGHMSVHRSESDYPVMPEVYDPNRVCIPPSEPQSKRMKMTPTTPIPRQSSTARISTPPAPRTPVATPPPPPPLPSPEKPKPKSKTKLLSELTGNTKSDEQNRIDYGEGVNSVPPRQIIDAERCMKHIRSNDSRPVNKELVKSWKAVETKIGVGLICGELRKAGAKRSCR